jgi:hypothetical protein
MNRLMEMSLLLVLLVLLRACALERAPPAGYPIGGAACVIYVTLRAGRGEFFRRFGGQRLAADAPFAACDLEILTQVTPRMLSPSTETMASADFWMTWRARRVRGGAATQPEFLAGARLLRPGAILLRAG